MTTKCFKTEWEYLDAQFRIIEILKEWESAESREEKSKKKLKKRNFMKIFKDATEDLNLKCEATRQKGVRFIFDEISDTAQLNLDERLILAFLLYSRFNASDGKASYQDIVKTIFRDRKQRLRYLHCLSAEGRLVKSGLIEQDGKDLLIAERVYNRFLRIEKEFEPRLKVVLGDKEQSSYEDFLKALCGLSDLMWERAQMIDINHIY